NLMGTRITDAGLIRLAALKNLKRISVTPSAVTSDGVFQLRQVRPDLNIVLNPLELHGLKHLVTYGGHGELNDEYDLVALDLHDSAVTDDDLLPVVACRQLHMVNLSGTSIGDAGLSCLRNLEDLRELWLTGTRVSDEGLKVISEFSHLKSISLARTQVSDTGIARFRSLTALEVLHIGETEVSDDGLQYLRELHQLKEVYVNESRVTTTGASELSDAISTVQVFGGSEPEKPVEEIESRVLG
ncbi:MAG: hypothetical protein QGH33_13600, partial [Pirellulaceae bacterium]|nr:hypothetical protein [Pirellulaceae bacterium]